MRFVWDDAKNRSNRRKHGISFETAVQVFFDPLHLTHEDRVIDGEQRWQTIGMIEGVLLVVVAYVVLDEEEEILRIISGRQVTRRERIEYEEANEI
ncbi:MAG TPA: BrnT family toxin [Acidobacteriaceae bacterium]|nr:BrnT family toxin [Acidobacteriaceae bacterium]